MTTNIPCAAESYCKLHSESPTFWESSQFERSSPLTCRLSAGGPISPSSLGALPGETDYACDIHENYNPSNITSAV
ncbi:hypothetical protein J6590_026978 [Homalodisca vitripennis]|nr:hypothetical protein J6590_026978 [Homalodisca vitripennis]